MLLSMFYCYFYVVFVLVLFGSVHVNVHVVFINIILLYIPVSLLCMFFYLFNVCVIFFVRICYVNTCVVVFVFIFLSFTNTFCLLNLQKIAKKESQSQVHFVVFLCILV